MRMFVAYDSFGTNPEQKHPCIFLSLSMSNNGGKMGHITDIKLLVSFLVDEREKLRKEFKALAEIDNFLIAEGKIVADPIASVALLGKSTQVRQYAFIPYDFIDQSQIPLSFDLSLKIFVKVEGEWQYARSYNAVNISGVWQDLNTDGPFRALVKDLIEAE